MNGFSQIACFPARTASRIICACSAGGVQISTRSIVGSATSARKFAVGLRDLVLLGERPDLIAARDRGRNLGVDAIDTLVGVHMQFGDEARADVADLDFGYAGAAPLLTRAGRR